MRGKKGGRLDQNMRAFNILRAHTPHSPLVTLECADPVTGLARADHGCLVVARREKEDAILRLVGELDTGDGARVAGTYERRRGMQGKGHFRAMATAPTTLSAGQAK